MTKVNKKIDAGEEMKEELENDILVVQEATHLDDGLHFGTIKNVVHENRQGFDYIDFYVDVEDGKGNMMTVKTGFPAYISSNSSLGRFLNEAGMKYKAGDKIELSKVKSIAIGRKISFQTFTEDNFAKVMNKTIKFA